jgi:hypothetical protein
MDLRKSMLSRVQTSRTITMDFKCGHDAACWATVVPQSAGLPYGQDFESIGATHAMQVKLHMQRLVSERPADTSGASLVVAERTRLSSPSVDLYD